MKKERMNTLKKLLLRGPKEIKLAAHIVSVIIDIGTVRMTSKIISFAMVL